MDHEAIARLTSKVAARLENLPKTHRFIIAIVGIPGSGKTTLAQAITTSLNGLPQAASAGGGPFAVAVPMDGFHYTRAYLSAMPNAAEAHARRGAAFTFDAEAWCALVTAVGAPLEPGAGCIEAPGFDHSVKDPVQAAIVVAPENRIVVCEGNYLALNVEPWKSTAKRYDEVWLVEVDKEVARERLVKRHLVAGIAATKEEAEKRAEDNDLVNGDEILANLIEGISERIRSN
ncbi:hypothetical protein Cpir12675_004634 [Ceratocystis pirilliformis]|uniref:Uridine kinase n=1 Tax=Ceratocystis pirilliformis TaxID=259994 RepID=A0ABR3YW92_9PEZI